MNGNYMLPFYMLLIYIFSLTPNEAMKYLPKGLWEGMVYVKIK